MVWYGISQRLGGVGEGEFVIPGLDCSVSVCLIPTGKALVVLYQVGRMDEAKWRK